MSDYIMDLRKIVGHRPLLQVGASVIVEDEQGKILLELRTDNHCWGYPGGSVGLDEAVEDAARRELFSGRFWQPLKFAARKILNSTSAKSLSLPGTLEKAGSPVRHSGFLNSHVKSCFSDIS